jgi:hypothetical protein
VTSDIRVLAVDKHGHSCGAGTLRGSEAVVSVFIASPRRLAGWRQKT